MVYSIIVDGARNLVRILTERYIRAKLHRQHTYSVNENFSSGARPSTPSPSNITERRQEHCSS